MSGSKFKIIKLCEYVRMSRQNYYKARSQKTHKAADKQLIVELIKQERHVQSELGIRKLQKLLRPQFNTHNIKVGRDALFDIAREEKLLIKKRKRSSRTTDSRHRFKVYRNLLKDKDLTGPDQAWVCDITYVRLVSSFVYLSLITDAYSRKVVAFNVGENLEAIGCMKALKKAIKQLPEGAKPIHHSDRGSQYCCHDYINILKKNELLISMTEENHCYENSKAERLNGILKYEYHIKDTFKNLKDAKKAIKQAVYLYNNNRPHTALGYLFPSDVHEKKSA